MAETLLRTVYAGALVLGLTAGAQQSFAQPRVNTVGPTNAYGLPPHCPPGLAKKSNGCRPPGHAKMPHGYGPSPYAQLTPNPLGQLLGGLFTQPYSGYGRQPYYQPAPAYGSRYGGGW